MGKVYLIHASYFWHDDYQTWDVVAYIKKSSADDACKMLNDTFAKCKAELDKRFNLKAVWEEIGGQAYTRLHDSKEKVLDCFKEIQRLDNYFRDNIEYYNMIDFASHEFSYNVSEIEVIDMPEKKEVPDFD